MNDISERLRVSLDELTDHLENGIIPFWLKNGRDAECGGFFTCFDDHGRPSGDTNKYLVTQTRMVWGFSALAGMYPSIKAYANAAANGVSFLIRHFWDYEYGGWYWKTAREGSAIDRGKVVYGQSFVIYALSEYTLSTRDPTGLEYAKKTFDLLQKFCADTYNGGYYENLERDWTVSEPGFAAGDRKSLDTHMHLMEAFTTLARCSGLEIHRRKLIEVISVILDKMTNKKHGCGLNQFTIDFSPLPAINIRRTWNAEREAGQADGREAGQADGAPADTTSYGHNVELAWLLNRAAEVLALPDGYFDDVTRRLLDHSLKYGFDHDLGGVYRDGPHDGHATVEDKEWWQNGEALVGYLDAYEKLTDEKYFDAFHLTWEFVKKYFINNEIGEWRQLLDKNGGVLNGSIGNPWKAFYHSGRSVMECIRRLRRLILIYCEYKL